MKKTPTKKAFDHSGSSFDSFLEEEGIRGEAETVAIKRVLAWQLEQAMREQRKTKQAMAKELHTSRSQLNRLLDPHNVSVSLEAITRAARVLGKRVTLQITDARGSRIKHPHGPTTTTLTTATRRSGTRRFFYGDRAERGHRRPGAEEEPGFPLLLLPLHTPATLPPRHCGRHRHVFEKKVAMLDAHVSQMYEWLPWLDGTLDQVPKEPAARAKWLAEQRSSRVLPEWKQALEKRYGAQAASVQLFWPRHGHHASWRLVSSHQSAYLSAHFC